MARKKGGSIFEKIGTTVTGEKKVRIWKGEGGKQGVGGKRFRMTGIGRKVKPRGGESE